MDKTQAQPRAITYFTKSLWNQKDAVW